MGITIQNNIEKLLNVKGWTKYRLSKESGVSMTVIYSLSSKECGPTAETLLKLADALGVSVDVIVR